MGGKTALVGNRLNWGWRASARLAALAVAVILIGTLGSGSFAIATDAQGWAPRAEQTGPAQTPTPHPSPPQINPVAPNDETAVRPDDMAPAEVNGLPASGIGYVVPTSGDVQRWTNVAVVALAVNAIALFGIACWSLRRRRL